MNDWFVSPQIHTFTLITIIIVISFICRIFSLYPLRFLSSKLSTCDQLSYRTEHMRTLSSVKPAAGHTQFMRWLFVKANQDTPRCYRLFCVSESPLKAFPRTTTERILSVCLSAGKPTSWCRSWWTWLSACCSSRGSTETTTSPCWPTRWCLQLMWVCVTSADIRPRSISVSSEGHRVSSVHRRVRVLVVIVVLQLSTVKQTCIL